MCISGWLLNGRDPAFAVCLEFAFNDTRNSLTVLYVEDIECIMLQQGHVVMKLVLKFWKDTVQFVGW